MWCTFDDVVRVATIMMVHREVNLVGPASALDAAMQPGLERVVASQPWDVGVFDGNGGRAGLVRDCRCGTPSVSADDHGLRHSVEPYCRRA